VRELSERSGTCQPITIALLAAVQLTGRDECEDQGGVRLNTVNSETVDHTAMNGGVATVVALTPIGSNQIANNNRSATFESVTAAYLLSPLCYNFARTI